MLLKKKQLGLIVIALALGAGACSSPGSRLALKRAHLIAAPAYYLSAEKFKTIRFDPPPAPDSDTQKADISAVLDWQKRRTGANCAKARATAQSDYYSFWGDKGPFPQPPPKEMKKFFGRISYDLDSAVTNMKKRFRRQRPYKAYPDRARPCVKESGTYAYPSGHSSFAWTFAYVLADIAPEHKAGFFAKADEIAQDRVIGGVHYPTDIAAGKVFGELYHAELLKSPEYLKDVEKMKTFLLK